MMLSMKLNKLKTKKSKREKCTVERIFIGPKPEKFTETHADAAAILK